MREESTAETRVPASAGDPGAGGGGRGIVVFWLLALALAVRLLAWYAFRDLEGLRGDEEYYVAVARSIAAGEGHPGSVRPPLYPAFLALCLGATNGSLMGARVAQLVLSLLTVWLTYRFALARFGGRAALFAGLLLAISPALAHYTHFLWCEGFTATLTILLFVLIDRFARFDPPGRPSGAAWIGLVLGLLALTRQTWIFFLPVLLVWLLWRARDRVGSALLPLGLLTLMSAAVVAPWTARNSALHGEFVLISTNRWFPVAMGNLFEPDRWFDEEDAKPLRRKAKAEAPATLSTLNAPGDVASEHVREAYWEAISRDAIRSHQPWWIGKKTVRNLAGLFSGKSQVLRFVRNGWVTPGRRTAQALVVVDVLGGMLLFVPALLGLALVRTRGTLVLVLLGVLEVLAVHVLANGEPRFLVGILPLLAIYAGAFLGGEFTWKGFGHWRTVLAGALLVGYLVLAGALLLPYLPEVWRGAQRFGG